MSKKDYEITYLVNPKLSESERQELDEKVDKLIQERDGEVSYTSPVDAPGSRRRLHYPIGGQRVTGMRVVQLRLDPAKIEPLRQAMRKIKNVLRVVVLQTERREEVSAEIFEEPEEAAKEEKGKEEKKASKEVTMEEVEEKIEQALDEEVK